MAQQARVASLWGRLGLGLCIAGAASLMAVLGNVESVLKADLSTALSDPSLQSRSDPATRNKSTDAIAWAASEDEWLGFAGRPRTANGGDGLEVKPVSWPEAVSKGDRMSLTWQGTERIFDIVEVKEVRQGPTHIDTRIDTPARGAMILVTGRLADSGDGTVIRFTIEQPGPAELDRLQSVTSKSGSPGTANPASFGPPRTL